MSALETVGLASKMWLFFNMLKVYEYKLFYNAQKASRI